MLKIVKRVACFFIFTALMLTSFTSSAEEMNCTSDSSAYTLNLGNIFVESHVQPGNIIFADTHEVHVTCRSSGNYQQVSEVTNTSWRSSGMSVNVDGTSCPVIDEGSEISAAGLGIVWTNFNSANGRWACMSQALTGSSTRRGLRANSTTTLIDKIYIVKTNKELKYGETNQLSQTVFVDEANVNRVPRGHLYSFSFTGNMSITAGGCTVDSGVNVNMGTLSSATFSGIGSTGPQVPFYIGLGDCYGAAKQAHFDFTPIYGFVNSYPGVVALNDESSAAKGAGIQLLMNGKAIAGFNDNIFPIRTGDNRVPFTARYYQTENSVTPGNADTTVIFNVFYN